MSKLPFTLRGRIIRGASYGRRLGFPTANLDRREYRRRDLRVREGVYAGSATVEDSRRSYKAALVVGPKEDRSGLPKIEAYLLGFTGVLYGKRIILSFKKYLRPFLSFKTERELKGQIRKDISKVREVVV